ncbi:MAG: LptF/LptG family permease [Candidatus Hydrogenedentes bacterium]|nr:LptF/LptG family permease [Candidatus Hydrogenedentota bacterium]MBI3117121.1 LptF/LptG family permease [Candidatus Hydrogenedentota bacterium]
MSLVDRYIVRQIWVPALLAAVVISVVLIGGAVQKEVVSFLNELPIAQFTLMDITRISLYAAPNLVGYIIPITFLLGIMLTFGRMAQSSELIALKAAGIPLKRLVLPIVLMGAALSVFTFFIFDLGQPWAFRRFHDLKTDMLVRLTLDMLPTGEMHQYGDEATGWRVYIGEKDPDGTLRDIVVLVPMGGGKASTYYAESAQLVKERGRSELLLKNGLFIQPGKDETMARIPFPELRRPVPQLSGESATGDEANTVSQLYQLQTQAAAALKVRQTIPVMQSLLSYRLAISERLSLPLMCLAVSVVAAPIGARTRRSGRSYTFASGFVIVAVYFLLRKMVEMAIGAALGAAILPELWQAALLAQIPNLALFCAGAALLWRVDRV